jgi:hypothetical protein
MKVYTLKHSQGRDFDTKTIPHPRSSGYYSPRHRRRCANACEWCLQVLLQSASKPGSTDGDGNHVDSPAHSKRGPMETGVSTTQSTAKSKACPVTYSHSASTIILPCCRPLCVSASTCTAVCSCAVNDDVKGVPVMFSHSVVQCAMCTIQ